MAFKINRISSSNKTIRMPDDMIEQIEELAAKNGVSFNKVVIQCCTYSLSHMEDEEEEEEEEADAESSGTLTSC